MRFSDRRDAGRRLARVLQQRALGDAVVLGLPRGGVVVAAEVAEALGVPLDVVLVRKLGLPSQPELAMGAIGEGSVRVLDHQVCRIGQVTDAEIAEVEAVERAELDRRVESFRSGSARLDLRGRTVVMVDDGIATGSSARAACAVVRARAAGRIILAVPVAPPDTRARFRRIVDEVVVLEQPERFTAVGQFYDDFTQVSDRTVRQLLVAAGQRVCGDPTPLPLRGGRGHDGGDTTDTEVS